MLHNKTLLLLPKLMQIIAVMVFIFLMRCEFDPSGIGVILLPPEDAPIADKTCSRQPQIFEDPGRLFVYHAYCCAESNQSGTENFLRVEGSLELPEYVTAATVFLNGWRLEYLSSDHHVRGLGTSIGRISFANQTLSWEAGGVLSDKNFDDGYRWCYYYTVIAWNEGEISALIDHDDANIFSNDDQSHTTAVKKISGYIQNVDLSSGDPTAILPRGYGFMWRGTVDHHLIQLAYNLDHSDRFIEYGKEYMTNVQPSFPTPAHYVGNGFTSWETKTIFKDDDLRREYDVGEIVSALGGRDVGIVQPPYTILPKEDVGWLTGCLYAEGGVKTEDYVVENVPFEYAIPMLTGWELWYPCDDQHVSQVGIWLSSFSYDKAPAAASGTLRYSISSVLADRDEKPNHGYSSQVQILGLKPTIGSGVPGLGYLSGNQR